MDSIPAHDVARAHAVTVATRIRPPVSFCSVAAMGLVLLHPGLAPAASGLAADDVQQLRRFERTAGLRDMPEWARDKEKPGVQRSYEEAQKNFAGRGPEVARHFLTHTGYPPANTAFFFVLEAVGDTETALVLIRALADPPKVESGPVIKVGDRSWLLERDGSEIRVAIESVLVNEPVRGDPRVVDALMEAITRLKARRGGAASAGTVVALLGRCAGPEARAALQKLAADADASIRSLALQGLGESARAAKAAPKDQAATLATLTQGLGTDPDPRTRLEAAGALGRLGSAEAVPPLRAALASERDPQVIDAVVLALGQLHARITDPQLCRDVLARTWEVEPARVLFSCWRGAATPEAVIEAATSGPAQLRALALYSLIERAAVRRRAPGLVRAPQLVAPPPPLAPPGARAITNVPVPPPGPREPSPVKFDEATRDRLLTSAVEVLSKHSAAFPGKGKEVSYTTAQLVRDALWEISGRDMGVALAHADRIAMTGARYFSGRYSASYDLWNRDRPAYLDYRRPRQAVAAALAALLFVPLFIRRRFRRAGALIVIAALGWGASSLTATDVRELPPPPLQFLTVSAIAFFSAGITAAVIALHAQSRPPGGMLKAAGRAGFTVTAAAVLAFFACGYTRWNDIFPVGGEGWGLIFDPIGSAIVAALIAMVLGLLDGLLLRRLGPAEPPR